jgi:hypothetical protein
LGVVVVLQRSNDGAAKLPSRSRSRSRNDDTTDLLRSATSTVEPLTTWTPPDALKPWTPPTGTEADEASIDALAPAPPEGPSPDADFWSTDETALTGFSDLAEPSADESTSWLDEPATVEDTFATPTSEWQDGSTWDDSNVAVDGNPLDDLARLDEIDVIAEFERLDGTERTGPEPSTSLFGVPADLTPINEDVSSADDIMAASQATELQVQQEDNSELAKLLAKVQARLAAYE